MNKKKWIIILIVVFIIPVIMMVYLVGCRQERLESKLKKVLSERYDEKFEVIDMYVLYGGLDSWPNKRYIATCRPVDNQDVVFEVDFWDYDIENGRDNYFHRYVAQQVEYLLQEDLERFFPDCYVHCIAVGVEKPQDNYLFKDKTLGKILDDSPTEVVDEYVYIYINGDVGTLKKYEEEYEYFFNEAKSKIGEMSIDIYSVNTANLEQVKEFYTTNSEPDSQMWELMDNSNNMFTSFNKMVPAYIENHGGIKGYIRLREEFESNNE